MEQIHMREITVANRSFHIFVTKEDLSALYPGFFRYTLTGRSGDTPVALFRTNSYEYAPGVPLHAEEVVLKKAGRWEYDLHDDTDGFLDRHTQKPAVPIAHPHADVVIVQASPRADGNSSTLAQWAEETARNLGMSIEVIYPHDMDIRECIGCYQCFNTGSCTFDDDMTKIIELTSRCRLLIICTPVYTNTVPANLKTLIDRFQAHFAAQTLDMAATGSTKGAILSAAGRPGQENFLCIKKVLTAFFHIAGIVPAGDVFIDSADRLHDLREIPGLRERVAALVTGCLHA